MGYYVTLEESTAVIPTDKLDEAYKRLCDLNKRDDLKTGGFPWMDPDYPSKCAGTTEIFVALGFECYEEDDGLHIESYDAKAGAEDLFVQTVADLFEPDTYMQWRGEEGEQWRWEFTGTKEIIHKEAVVTWE